MGTMLYGKGVFLNRSFDELNLTQPDLVAEIHQAYVRAGADVLETNTFGANRLKLAPFGLGERLREINAAGVRIARQAARGQAYVAGAIGPLGVRVEPWGKTGLDEAEAAFREQAEALAEAGVDLFMLETFGDVAELGAAVRGVRAVSDKPVVAQLTTGDDGVTADGTPPEQFTAELEALGADVIGLNCSVGPAAMLETIERIAERTTARLSVQPNAGRPRDVEGRNIYLSSPEYMASYARRFVAAGVRLVGGCCGTTPEHTRQMRVAATAPAAGGRAGATRATVSAAVPPPIVQPVPRAEKSRLASTLVARPVRARRRARSAARPRDAGVRRARPPAADSRRRRAARHGSPGQPGPDGAARGRAAARASGRHRNRAAVPLPRSPPGRHAGRAARRARARAAQHPARHRRADPSGRLSRRDPARRGGLDRRRQRGEPAQSRHRPRRSADRRADGVPHRRPRQSRRRSTSTRRCGAIATRPRPGPSSR